MRLGAILSTHRKFSLKDLNFIRKRNNGNNTSYLLLTTARGERERYGLNLLGVKEENV